MAAQMDLAKQIEKFKEFFEELYLDELLERLRKGKLYLNVPFSELAIFNPELATNVLESPDESIKAAQMSLQNIDLQGDVKEFEVRFSDLPASQHVMVRNIRSEHIGRFLQIEGIVRQKSDVRPQVTSARFECPSCGNIIPVLQLDKKFREPSRCGCGRKGKFHLLSKQLVDAQNIVLEEAPEDLEGGEQPKRMNVILQKDLVSPMSDRKTNPGSKIVATGVVKEVPISLPTGGQSTRFDLMIDANFVDAMQEDYTQIKISKEEEQEIVEFAQGKDPFGKLVNSLAPTIYGHDQVKEALVLQLLGGCRKSKDEGVKSRGDIHVLLIGDPGAGKCVAKDTLIQLENGLIQPINELFSEQKSNLIEEGAHKTKNAFSVVSLQENGQVGINNVPTIWRRRTNKLLRVRMRSGTELLVTHEHPFFTTKNGVIHSIPAQELQKGTPVASPKKIVVNTRLQDIVEHTKSRARNKISIKAPAFVTPYFARLLGYLTGDGWVSKKTNMVSLTNNDEETLKDYKNILSSMKVNHTTRNPHKGKTAKEVYSCSSEFHSLIIRNAPTLIKEKTTPVCVMKSSNEVVAHFLRGLFECDAHVSPLSRSIQLSTKSEQLAQEVRMLLLRFSIQSQLTKKMKCATNTIKKTKRRHYELVISGENVTRYEKHIGFVTTRKQQVLSSYTQRHNTNRDVIPGLKDVFRVLRAQDKKRISDVPVAYGSYRHYEKGDRLPSRTQAKKILASFTNNSVLLDLAKSFVNADVFWDFIEEIREEESDGYVYDLEVSTTHNFVANTAYIHNSQLLKRVSNVAPKARFVGGKGASGAGLCVAPSSRILSNPGGMQSIERVVEEGFNKPEMYCPGVWREEGKHKITIQSLSHELKVQAKKPATLWKLEAPEQVFEITLSSGKKVELTGNTQLFSIQGNTCWKKSSDIRVGDFVATPRKLIGGDQQEVRTIDLISSNPVVHDVEHVVLQCVNKLKKEFGSIRALAKKLCVNENNLYHHWVRKDKRGTIKLKTFNKVCSLAKIDPHKHVKTVSLYNGKKYCVPEQLSKDFFYVAGLIASDGDIRKNNNTISIRLSGNETTFHKTFQKLLVNEFKLNFDVQKKTCERPVATRCNSKILGELFIKQGITLSPKSDKVHLSEELLHVSNDLLSEYLAGLYDGDGSVTLRKTRGSNTIELFTCSEELARQVQLVLLRYEIHSTLRTRNPTVGKIKSKLRRWIVTVSGADNCSLFAKNIPLRHPKKRENLQKIISLNKKANTNTDIIPGAGVIIKPFVKGKIKQSRWHNNLSRNALQRIIKENNILDEEIKKVAFSDIYWEKVKEVKVKKPDYDYVYDLTVNDSHNFVVDGVLVHNTASVVKDEFLRGWALEAGALVLANRGLVCIDELDKMSDEDRSAMHEALEQQTVTISKANIQATLRSETTVLAAANPKFGRFDPYEVLAKQIDLPSTLINRFDLIFPIRDMPSEENDTRLAQFILNLHQRNTPEEAELSKDFIRKYLSYARLMIRPALSDEALEEIRNYYVKMRNSGGGSEGQMKAIPISARQLEALVRLSEASAKSRLSKVVTQEDARKGIGLVDYCLRQIGVDPESGQLDIDRITTGITAKSRSNIHVVKEIINELVGVMGDSPIPIEDVVRECELKGVSEKSVEEILEKLKRSGDVYSPKQGFISKI